MDHLDGSPGLILCMGDTLTHLSSTGDVEVLCSKVADALAPAGQVLALLGAAIAAGLLAPLRWPALAFAAVALFAIRPLSCFVGFVGSRQPRPVRLAIGYFGIRGLGSLYYMSYAGGTGQLQDVQQLWAVVALVVLLSVVIYGISANPIMQRLDAHHRRRGAGRESGSWRGGPEPPQPGPL